MISADRERRTVVVATDPALVGAIGVEEAWAACLCEAVDRVRADDRLVLMVHRPPEPERRADRFGRPPSPTADERCAEVRGAALEVADRVRRESARPSRPVPTVEVIVRPDAGATVVACAARELRADELLVPAGDDGCAASRVVAAASCPVTVVPVARGRDRAEPSRGRWQYGR